MLRALEQACATEGELRSDARALLGQLVHHHLAAGEDGEFGNIRVCRDGRAQGRPMQRRAALRINLGAAEARVLADYKVEGGVDLVVDAVRTFVALDQDQAGASLDDDKRTRKHRGGTL